MTELEEVDGGGSGGGGGETALLALEGEPPTPLSTKAPLSEGSGERERGERAMQVREAPSRPDGEHKQYGLTDYTQYDSHVTW